MEAELRSARNENVQQRDNYNNAMSSMKRDDRDHYQTTIHDLEAQVIKLTRNLDVSKSEVNIYNVME